MAIGTDGTAWIKNWQTDIFPDAVKIVDYFHAPEPIYAFSPGYFNDGDAGKAWVNDQAFPCRIERPAKCPKT